VEKGAMALGLIGTTEWIVILAILVLMWSLWNDRNRPKAS